MRLLTFLESEKYICLNPRCKGRFSTPKGENCPYCNSPYWIDRKSPAIVTGPVIKKR